MGVQSRHGRSLPSTTAVRQRALSLVFGDRAGLTLFLAIVTTTALYWRIGVFINDNYTIANTLLNVAEGHLQVTHVRYGPSSGATPGMVIHDGRLYGRNYGLVVAAVPFLWFLQALAVLADPRIALTALWSLLALALAVQLGHLLNHHRQFAIGGSAVALAVFALNVAVAHPLSPGMLPLAALQLSTLVWTGLLGVVVYRLTTHVTDRRVGTFAGLATVIGTPVGFWASIPKRHVLIALLAMVAVAAFYWARANPRQELRYRMLSYAAVGMSAWVFPFEAALLLLVFAPLDLLTARSNAPRRLALVGLVFLLALLPSLVTNTLVSGNPLRPPGLLPPYSGAEQVLADEAAQPARNPGTGAGGSGGGTADSGGSTSLLAALTGLILTAVETGGSGVNRLWTDFLMRGLAVVVTEPARVYHTFVRSGYIEEVAAKDGGQAINLALLETMPLLGALVAGPLHAVRSRRDGAGLTSWLSTAAGQTDVLVGAYALLVTITYLPTLPQGAMVTVRYLLAILPGLVYLLVRIPPIRETIRTRPRTLAFAAVATTTVGGQLVVIVLALQSLTLGGAMQLHAWLGLASAALVAGWTLPATVGDRVYPRIGAACLGIAVGTTTVFLLLSGLNYFAYAGALALPISERLSELLQLLGG